MKFAEEVKNEVDWENVELAKEFAEHGNFVLDNLIKRSALQIVQITASHGNAPVITLPVIVE